MKSFSYQIIVLFLLSTFVTFAQSNEKQVKQAETLLSEAGHAFVDLEVDKSLNLSKKALNIAHQINDDVLMAKAYNLIGLNFEEFYDIKKGVEYYEKALHHANLSTNDSIKCWVSNNLGNVYSYRKNNLKKRIAY